MKKRKSDHKHNYSPVLSCHRYISWRDGKTIHETWGLVNKCSICGNYKDFMSGWREWIEMLGKDKEKRLKELKEKYPIDEEYDFLTQKIIKREKGE